MAGTPERRNWNRVSALLDQAFELEPAQLQAFFAQIEVQDRETGELLRGLLAADAQNSGVLDGSLDDIAAPLFGRDDEIGALAPGTLIGHYRIVREVGHGGMGRVYEAERADGAYEHRVALKVVRAGLSWGALRDRFLQERQILASLDHPNLARLLDGGVTDDGRPYFAMEFVAGQPITDYAATHDLDLRARLELFRDVCAAVAHAQRRLVVHRDLKPSNILVTGEGEAKLLDFGIARLLGSGEEAGFTQFGPRLLTPEYAAPEQLEGGTITTATDVFALGRVLQELLSADSSGEQAGRLPRDLLRIVRKATAADPDRRYPAAAALGEDLARFLGGYPVQARPAAPAYVIGRFMARNKLAAGAAAAVVLTLIAGVVATTWQADRAQQAAERATRITEFLVSLFGETDPDIEQGRETSAREILARGSARIETELAGDPALQSELFNLTGELLMKRGDYAHAEEQFERALAIRESMLGANDPAVAESLSGLGEAKLWQSEFEPAREAFRRALAIERQRAPVDEPALAQAASNLAAALRQLGEGEAAESLYHEALELNRRAFGPLHLTVAQDLDNLGIYYWSAGRHAEALEMHMQALDMMRELLPEQHTRIALVLHNIGESHFELDHFEEAERYLRQAVAMRQHLYQGPHPRLASSQRVLGRALQQQDRLEEAWAAFDESIATLREYFGDVHYDVASALNDLAVMAFLGGDLVTARERFTESLAVFEQLLPAGHPTLLTLRQNLGRVAMDLGDLDETYRIYTRVLEEQTARLGEDHPEVGDSWYGMATVHERREEWPEALAAIERALEVYRHSMDSTSASIAVADTVKGRVLIELNRPEEAEDVLRRALASLALEFESGHRRLTDANVELARVLMLTGRVEEALPLMESTVAARRATYGERAPRTGDALAVLAECQLMAGKRLEARATLDEGLAILTATRGAADYQTRRAEALAAEMAPP